MDTNRLHKGILCFGITTCSFSRGFYSVWHTATGGDLNLWPFDLQTLKPLSYIATYPQHYRSTVITSWVQIWTGLPFAMPGYCALQNPSGGTVLQKRAFLKTPQSWLPNLFILCPLSYIFMIFQPLPNHGWRGLRSCNSYNSVSLPDGWYLAQRLRQTQTCHRIVCVCLQRSPTLCWYGATRGGCFMLVVCRLVNQSNHLFDQGSWEASIATVACLAVRRSRRHNPIIPTDSGDWVHPEPTPVVFWELSAWDLAPLKLYIHSP